MENNFIVNDIKMPRCPLCGSIDISYLSKYPGSFYSCKNLIQCSECKLIFAYPMPTDSNLDNYYEEGLYYDKASSPFEKSFLEFSFKLSKTRLDLILNHINFNQSIKVIDIGAGNGQFGLALKEIDGSFAYDVVEPDKTIASQYGDFVSKHFNNISEPQLNSYDLVIMNQVLEHVSNPLLFLESVLKLLNPNGYVYIDVPYQDFLFKPSVEPHILFWNQESLETLTKKIGLKIIFCDTVGMPHSKAKVFFNPISLIEKIYNPWLYAGKINRLLGKIRIPKLFSTFRHFHAESYGGDRQWLRCIAQKIN